MKIIEIQRKADNIYTVTFEKKNIFGKKIIARDVFNCFGYIKYVSDNSYSEHCDSIINLITLLNGYEPLKVN